MPAEEKIQTGNNCFQIDETRRVVQVFDDCPIMQAQRLCQSVACRAGEASGYKWLKSFLAYVLREDPLSC